ncbi:hypothetical protein DFH94DRAFT_679101 [Russula ochroleuca]|uniref:DUF6532 domain-containing protein n=1 Tax=Russula ochroleuca TaxID=152965 RepID=A0A9P5N4Y0_9AGAM|nr:hypothetical protein DFH94DRAFT_679101 [Russula ochroleuca]
MWESPICTSGTISGSTGFSSVTQADGVNTSPEGSGGGADAPLVPDQPDTTWPSDTELIVVPGTNKMLPLSQLLSGWLSLPLRSLITGHQIFSSGSCVMRSTQPKWPTCSETDVARLVKRQLSNYNYTFPTSLNHNPLSEHALLLRMWPYRNSRIISVIQDLYFTGGTSSFAQRFDSLFPTDEDHNGVVMREVPVPMVALVATALYATIHEWHTG